MSPVEWEVLWEKNSSRVLWRVDHSERWGLPWLGFCGALSFSTLRIISKRENLQWNVSKIDICFSFLSGLVNQIGKNYSEKMFKNLCVELKC